MEAAAAGLLRLRISPGEDLKNTWLFPVIEAIHLAGIALLVGAIALPETKRNLTGWSHAGLLIVIATGLAMFSADSARYLNNPAFRIKMDLFVAALLGHFVLRRRGRIGALLAVFLWTLVAIAGRAIADFDL